MKPKGFLSSSSLTWGPFEHPLAWTVYFIVLNSFLAYFAAPLVWKLSLGFLGLVLPVGFFLWETPQAGRGEYPLFLDGGRISKIPGWAIGAVLFVGLGLRILDPGAFTSWPLFDETVNAYYALQLDQHWTWHPFFFYSQLPPLLIWMMFLCFKVLGSFLSVIRFLPLLLSTLVLFLAYPAARMFFSGSFSFLFLSLTALSFGPLFFGRLCHQGLLVLVMEFLAFWGLGKLLQNPNRGSALKLFLLGLCIGIGFYTYFSWLLVAIFLSVLVLLSLFSGPLRGKSSGVWLILGILPPLAPLLFAALTKGYGHYLGELWSLKTGNDWAHQIQTTCFCLSSFLWGNNCGFFSYGPIWGGFLNPVLGSFFLIGLMEFWHFRREPLPQAVLGGTAFFLLPALLTNSLTNMREIQVIPFLLLISAVGILKLSRAFPGRGRILILVPLLSASLALDVVHLGKLSPYIAQRGTFEIQKAYEILDRISRQEGPGLVLTTFSNGTYTYDGSLLVSTYPFNAAKNPALNPLKARWLSVVTNVHFQPFLSKRFLGSQWFRLSSERAGAEDDYSGGLVLGVIPLNSTDRGELAAWIQADLKFAEMSSMSMDLPGAEARRKILDMLAAMKSELPMDPFIRSCYWEMVYFNYNWENLYGDKNFSQNLPAARQALENALREGYPTAYFHNELGSLLAIQGDRAGAMAAFQRAVFSKPNETPAAENLRALENLK